MRNFCRKGLLQCMMDQIDEYAFILLDEKGNIRNWNIGAEKLKGYLATEAIGKNFRIFYTEEDQKKLLPEYLLQIAKENGKATYLGWSVRKDGTKFWRDTLLVPLSDNDNNTTGFSIISRDFTDSKKQDEFDHSNLFALINNTPDPIWSVDRNYQLITSNDSFDESVRLSTGKEIRIRGNVLEYPVHTELINKYKQYYDRAFAGENFSVFECTNTPFEKWSEISFYPIRTEGVVIGTACFSHDITRKKIAEEKLKSSEYRFRSLIENSADGVAIQSARGEILYISPSIVNVLGYTDIEFMQFDPVFMVHPDDISSGAEILRKVLENPGVPVQGYVSRKKHKNGSWRWIESSITNRLNDSEINGIVTNFRDITERKLAEEKIHRSNRLYAFISRVSQTIVREIDEDTLFTEICNIAIHTGKFRMVWIGSIDRNINEVIPLAFAGEERGYLTKINVFSIEEKPEGNGPLGMALREGKSMITNDIANDPKMELWKEKALSRGYKSGIALPIIKTGEVTYSLTLYSSETNFFDSAEIELLENIVNDISFKLDAIENEKLRVQTEHKLKQSELRLNQAQEIAHLGHWNMDYPSGIAVWSEETCRIYGLLPNDNIQSFESWVSFIHPDDLQLTMELVKAAEATRTNKRIYHRIIRRDGVVRYILTQWIFEFNNEGNTLGLYGVALDITILQAA